MLSIRPKRSYFDLSHEKKFDCDFGELIPILCEEVVPGDKLKINTQTVIRTQPCVSPFLHEVDVFQYYFYVPYRILDTKWEEFITGGRPGNSDIPAPTIHDMLNGQLPIDYDVLHSIWDYMSFPVYKNATVNLPAISGAVSPLAYPFLAYCNIYDEYFRDQNFQRRLGGFGYVTENETDGDDVPLYHDATGRLYCSPSTTTKSQELRDIIFKGSSDISAKLAPYRFAHWKKDYFTSALPFQQRGVAPTVPVDYNDFSAHLIPSYANVNDNVPNV